jgi:hypothetical protein
VLVKSLLQHSGIEGLPRGRISVVLGQTLDPGCCDRLVNASLDERFDGFVAKGGQTGYDPGRIGGRGGAECVQLNG